MTSSPNRGAQRRGGRLGRRGDKTALWRPQPLGANGIRYGRLAIDRYGTIEVVRAGIRLLMERDGARQFYAMKAELEEAVQEAEAGGFEAFDPPGLRARRRRAMTIRLSRLARRDLDDFRRFTVRTWGREQWLAYYRGLVRAFEAIAADPDGERDRSLYAAGLRSVNSCHLLCTHRRGRRRAGDPQDRPSAPQHARIGLFRGYRRLRARPADDDGSRVARWCAIRCLRWPAGRRQVSQGSDGQ